MMTIQKEIMRMYVYTADINESVKINIFREVHFTSFFEVFATTLDLQRKDDILQIICIVMHNWQLTKSPF